MRFDVSAVDLVPQILGVPSGRAVPCHFQLYRDPTDANKIQRDGCLCARETMEERWVQRATYHGEREGDGAVSPLMSGGRSCLYGTTGSVFCRIIHNSTRRKRTTPEHCYTTESCRLPSHVLLLMSLLPLFTEGTVLVSNTFVTIMPLKLDSEPLSLTCGLLVF